MGRALQGFGQEQGKEGGQLSAIKAPDPKQVPAWWLWGLDTLDTAGREATPGTCRGRFHFGFWLLLPG